MQIEMIERFFEWINERHIIYLHKEVDKEPWPWTDDPILQEFKFTNVFRELDKGTIWYKEHWREPFADHPKLFFNTCLYRQFNYWQTTEFIGFSIPPYSSLPSLWEGKTRDWNANALEIDLRVRQKEGHQIFTGAHMLTGTLGGKEKKDKIWQVVQAVLNVIWENEDEYKPQPGDTLQKAFKRMLKAPGFGPFLAYEVVTDLRHTHYLENASDIMTWANPGPGAMRGINRLFGYPVGRTGETHVTKSGNTWPKYHPVKMMKEKEYIAAMRELLEMSSDYLEEHVPSLEMRDVEHSLCEFDKYERARLGQGRPRSRYTPPQV